MLDVLFFTTRLTFLATPIHISAEGLPHGLSLFDTAHNGVQEPKMTNAPLLSVSVADNLPVAWSSTMIQP